MHTRVIWALLFGSSLLGPSSALADGLGLASWNGQSYVAFQANDPSYSLYTAVSQDGLHFASPTGHEKIALDSAPALASFKALGTSEDKLYIAFKGFNDPNHALYTAQSEKDGLHFNHLTGQNITLGSAPALETFKASGDSEDKLYIAFKGFNDSNLYTANSEDGLHFSHVTGQEITLGSAPALATFKDKLYIAFRGPNDSNLYTADSEDGLHFNHLTGQGISLGSAPALTTFKASGDSENKLYIAFRGASDPNLYTADSEDGLHFAHSSTSLPDSKNPITMGPPTVSIPSGPPTVSGHNSPPSPPPHMGTVCNTSSASLRFPCFSNPGFCSLPYLAQVGLPCTCVTPSFGGGSCGWSGKVQ